MDGGRTLESGIRGKSVADRIWSAINGTAAVLAAITRFFARSLAWWAARFQGATDGLDRVARWSNAKALGIPLVPVGVDVAGDDWEEPEILPLAPEPPPIPPRAFFNGQPTPAEEAEWRVALEAAKHSEPETDDEWTAALAAAKAAKEAAQKELDAVAVATPAPIATPEPTRPSTTQPRVTATRAAVTSPVAPARPRPSAPQPVRLTAEMRVGPKNAVAARAVEPRITSRGSAVVASAPELGSPKTGGHSVVDPHVAAATKKTIAAALRT